MKKFVLLSFIIIGAFTSCHEIYNPATYHDRLKSIFLGTHTLNIYVGETRQLSVITTPSNYNSDSLKWKSSDTAVVSLSSTGIITAKKTGLVTITISNLSNTVSISGLVNVNGPTSDSLKIGLIAYYPFDNNAADSSGNGNNGTAYKTTPTTDRHGKANSAYYFDGQSSYIRVKDAPELRLCNTDFSINSWISLDKYNVSFGSVIMDKRGPGSSGGWDFGISGYQAINNYVGVCGVTTFSVSGGDDPFVAGTVKVDTTRWHMITVLYTVSKKEATIYIDGRYDNVAENIPAPNARATADIFIGKDNPNVFNGYFVKGKIDDIRIYGRKLKTTEIQKLYMLSN